MKNLRVSFDLPLPPGWDSRDAYLIMTTGYDFERKIKPIFPDAENIMMEEVTCPA
jgi:hypothetical protein